MGKVSDFQQQLQFHDHHRLNILKKAPQSSACDRTVTLIDRFDNQSTSCLMFGSNNYLGLISESRCIEAAVKTTKAFGIGSGGVPLLTGTNILQNHLEAKIAAVKGFIKTIWIIAVKISPNIRGSAQLEAKNPGRNQGSFAQHRLSLKGCGQL